MQISSEFYTTSMQNSINVETVKTFKLTVYLLWVLGISTKLRKKTALYYLKSTILGSNLNGKKFI